MNLTSWAWTYAVVFIILGILGFIPAVTVGGLFLNTFILGTGLSLVFLASGILAAIAALSSPQTEKMYFQVFGIVFLIMALAGFVQGTTVLGLFGINIASSVFALIAAAGALYLGYGANMAREKRLSTTRVRHI